jgi:hypothetical protein
MAEHPTVSIIKLLDNMALRELRVIACLLRHLIQNREQQELRSIEAELARGKE